MPQNVIHTAKHTDPSGNVSDVARGSYTHELHLEAHGKTIATLNLSGANVIANFTDGTTPQKVWDHSEFADLLRTSRGGRHS